MSILPLPVYRFIPCPADVYRVVQSVLIDKRAAIPAISGQVGSVIKAYTDTQAAIAAAHLFYKIETTDMSSIDGGFPTGVLAGYFTLDVSGSTVTRIQYELRPAYEQFTADISNLIAIFISSGDWTFDTLI